MKTLSTINSKNISKEDLLNSIISKQSTNAAGCGLCVNTGGGND